MSFVYYTRKPEDVKAFKEFQMKRKDLMEEYNKVRTDYDKSLEKYSCLLKKLDNVQKDSIEHKALIVDLETLSKLLCSENVVSKSKAVNNDLVELKIPPTPKRKRNAVKKIKCESEEED
jgi:hypothetical protein